tara:strand:- start:91 stop:762 length:672 start_codon:yes stop_codon:yes gene_type:complete
MAEIEIGGAKITGGKLFWALPLLGALGSGAWGGFTLYQEFLDLREATLNYVSPDMSAYDNSITTIHGELQIVETNFDNLLKADELMAELVREMVNDLKEKTGELQSQVHDLRDDLKNDIASMKASLEHQNEKQEAALSKVENEVETTMEKQETRNRQSVEDVNKTSADNVEIIRGLISSSEERRDRVVDRLDTKLAEIQRLMDTLSSELDAKIVRALSNPLSK